MLNRANIYIKTKIESVIFMIRKSPCEFWLMAPKLLKMLQISKQSNMKCSIYFQETSYIIQICVYGDYIVIFINDRTSKALINIPLIQRWQI